MNGGTNGVPNQNSLNGSGGDSGVTQFLPLLGRNSFKQPSIFNLDMRVSRRFTLRERYKLETLVEAFNLPNTFQVTGVQGQAYSVSGSTLQPNAVFGTATAAGNGIYRERQVQLSARFEF